jgi:hypothetical protein|tara:strand:+ start:533 stop:733 length:201 start_codon:yes stop_codon:yes gene_type:complete
MNFLDKLLMLVIAFSTILSLIFISMIIIDLNDTWNAINETMKIIKEQEDRIRDLQILIISRTGVGI